MTALDYYKEMARDSVKLYTVTNAFQKEKFDLYEQEDTKDLIIFHHGTRKCVKTGWKAGEITVLTVGFYLGEIALEYEALGMTIALI
jgi:hypothetical protein